jgi:hypothetical protein
MPDTNKANWKPVAIITVIALLVLYFVWPTPYEYTRKYPNVIRVNRFTGASEKSTNSGWVRQVSKSEVDQKALAEKDAIYECVELVDYEITPPRQGETLYEIKTRFKNGSSKALILVSLKFKILDKNGALVGSFNSKLWSDLGQGRIAEPITSVSIDELTGVPFSVKADGYECMKIDP